MKLIEAMISLVVFVSLLITFKPVTSDVDNSLYKVQLINDIWRVFQLRGDLEDFDKVKMNNDANEITKITGLCIEFEEEDVTSCIPTKEIIQVKKVAIVNGKPKILKLRIGLENK